MSPLSKNRVLMVTDSLQMGGAEQVAVDLANTLDRSSYDVRFCATRGGGPLTEGLHDDVELMVLGRRATWDIPKLLEFVRFVRGNRVDIVHTHGRGTMRFVALARALGLIDVRHVFHDHFGWLHLDREASTALRVPLQRWTDFYIGVDSRLCRWAVDTAGLPPERVRLIRSGVQLDRFADAQPADLRAEFDLEPADLAVLMVANFRPQKDHPTLFRALAELSPEHQRQIRIVICGSTTADRLYYDGCVGMIERLGIGHLVRIAGPRDDVPSLIAGADAAVLSSKNETGPLVLLEYMARARPFVATDTGEIAHAVRDKGVGILVEPRDHLAMADALTDLVEMSAAEREAMGARGQAVVEELFDERVVVNQVEAVYRGVLDGGDR